MAAVWSKRKATATQIEDRRRQLADTTANIERLALEREAKLLESADTDTVADVTKLDAEIASELIAGARLGDTIAALERRAEADEAERQAEFHKDMIARGAAKLRESDNLAKKLEALLGEAVPLFREMVGLRQDAMTVWNFKPHQIETALLSPPSITAAVGHELFRISGGLVTCNSEPSTLPFPGARCSTIDAMTQPEKIPPLSATMRQATQMAVEIMHNTRALAMKKTTAADFDDITAAQCPQACSAERCVISGRPYCAHPLKGGLQGRDMIDQTLIARVTAVKKTLRRNEATQDTEQENAQ